MLPRADRFIKAEHDLTIIPYDYIISIENGIETLNHFDKGGDHAHFLDLCYVVLETKDGTRQEAESYPIPIGNCFINQAQAATSSNYKYADLGFEVTAGAMIHQAHPDIPADDWMADPRFYGRSRVHQIASALAQIKIDAI